MTSGAKKMGINIDGIIDDADRPSDFLSTWGEVSFQVSCAAEKLLAVMLGEP